MKPLLTLHTPSVANRYYEQGYWRTDTLYSLLREHAAQRPDGFAVRDSERRLTFAELLSAVDQLACYLQSEGLVPGDRVCIWLPNSVESLVAYLACVRNGYVGNPSLHQNFTVEEVVRFVQRLRARILFIKPGYGADAKEKDIAGAMEAMPDLKRIVPVGDEASGPQGLRFELPEVANVEPMEADLDPDKVIYLAFTSGTTGEPKGVMHSHNTLLANARGMVQDWGLGQSDVLYALSPMSHHIGTVAMAQALVSGCELVISDLPSKISPVDWIIETGATYVMGVPTHAMDIMSELRRRGAESFGSVRTFYMAGSPIPRSLAEAFLEMGTRPQNVYGMTENGSHQFTRPQDDVDTIVDSCGRACLGYETAIWNAETPDDPMPTGTVGEIGTRGAQLMLGYYDNQTATENSFNASGWFLSGDLGWLDEKGCLHIVGRKKDLIIRGGHNIHPTDIEAVAIRHPALKSVAVIPVPDERLGEKVCLAVIETEEEQVGPQQVLDFLHKEGLSKYDMPEYYISMASFPMTASGKILKRTLADWARDGSLKPMPVRWVDPAKAKGGA